MNQEDIYALAKDLIQKLRQHERKIDDKYDFYDADNTVRDFGISTPRRMISNRPGVGWASRAVNTISDRVEFDGFGSDRAGINNLLAGNNGIKVLNKAKHDAIIAGMASVAVAGDTLIPFTAYESTGEIDITTGLYKWALAVIKRNKLNKPEEYLLFTPMFTVLFVNDVIVENVDNLTGRTLLHPVTRRSSASRPLGKAKISNTVRRIIQEVGRVKRRYEIAGEFYSTPQRYLVGMAETFEQTDKDKLDSSIGRLWAIGNNENGDAPTIGQLQQMSINQFNDNKKDLARDFCAETGLTLRNLGYETSNPTSVESLTALSDDMLLEAKGLQSEIGEQFKNIMITMRMNLDGVNVVSNELNSLEPSWKPIFQVDLGAAGDAIYKLKEVMPELFNTTAGYRMLGLSMRESEALLNNRANDISGFMRSEQ